MNIKIIFTFLIILGSSIAYSQQSELEKMFKSMPIEEQYDYVYEKSESYERYKVIRTTTFQLLKKSSLDSINAYKNDLTEFNNEIRNLNQTVGSKDQTINTLSKDLEALKNTKDSMKFMGTEISKGAYNTILWSIVLSLAVLVALFFLLFKRSNSVTSEVKKRLSEVEDEFENHRKNALKREQKLARELMDEKLKHKF